MSTDAIVLLKEDHKEIRKLFRAFKATGPDAHATRANLTDKILEALTVHTYVENEVMYPRVSELVPELRAEILESFEEHHVADVLCQELALMSPENERYDAKTFVLIEAVSRHIEEEEDDWFPKVRAALGRKELQDIGAQLLDARARAPHRPEQPGVLRKAADALLG
ncbi:hemerythrin domain-containing protein [Streptacidiphilus melanogenes]|uniref:hemerythrin domain-containing protein n=1 Tax=Streptacidiphilus melanogenes TaxID=411235 RepID=UPI0005A61E18|nr:hemerythrin domain-containing protein [Streptacidiphilus melanogenes]